MKPIKDVGGNLTHEIKSKYCWTLLQLASYSLQFSFYHLLVVFVSFLECWANNLTLLGKVLIETFFVNYILFIELTILLFEIFSLFEGFLDFIEALFVFEQDLFKVMNWFNSVFMEVPDGNTFDIKCDVFLPDNVSAITIKFSSLLWR